MPATRALKGTVALEMAVSIEEQAQRAGIPMRKVAQTMSKNINDLDELFEDGGHVRCVHFMDIGDQKYARQFGEIESPDWEIARFEVKDLAVELLELKYL